MADSKILDKMDSRLERVEDRLSSIDITLSRLTDQVEIHVQRSNKLEDIVLPIQRRVYMGQGILAFLAFVGLIAGIWAAFK